MKYCPNCGGQMQDNAGFCGNCGNMLTQPDEAAKSSGNPGAGLGMKYKIIIGAVLTVLLVTGGFWGWNTYGTEARVQAKLELAVKYLNENKFEEAILAYNEAIKIDPRNIEVRVGLAQAYIGISAFLKAEETVSTARGIGTIVPEQYQKLIAAYIKQGMFTEAERLLAEAREKYAANAFIADAEKLLNQEKVAVAALNNPPPVEPSPATSKERIKPLTLEDFSIGIIKCGNEKSQVIGVLGQPQSERTYLAMSSYNILVYPDIEVKLVVGYPAGYSEGDDVQGWVQSITLKSPKYQTIRGLRVGDSINKLYELYGQPSTIAKSDYIYDDLTSIDVDSSNGNKYITRKATFSIKSNIVNKVDLEFIEW